MTGKMDQPNPLFENAMMPLTSQVATNVKPIPKEEVTTITTLQNCGEIWSLSMKPLQRSIPVKQLSNEVDTYHKISPAFKSTLLACNGLYT